MFARVIVIVLDGAGIGELPDAGAYGDEGSNTLGHVAAAGPLRVPVLVSLGLNRLVAGLDDTDPSRRSAQREGGASTWGPPSGGPEPRGARGRMAERSAGKDSVTGHWELMGIVLERPFPTFPHGFPAAVIAEFERRIGRPVLGNVVASGTAIIDRLGAEHLATGRPIVYTSADSVFQIAAHETVVPVAQLYEWCEIAYAIVVEGLGVGRVIARPFVGAPGAFTRTARRHDYAMPPPGETLLDRLTARGVPVRAIGKIHDLFAGRGIAVSTPTASDAEGMDRVLEAARSEAGGLVFANLVDFDTVYGHRNDVDGYARNLERFDARLGELLEVLRPDDLLVITADHGNDPATPSTDHAREYVPVLLAGAGVRSGVDIGTRASFADLGQTLAAVFGVGPLPHGVSFLEEIR